MSAMQMRLREFDSHNVGLWPVECPQAEEQFGKPCARLFPLLGLKVRTLLGIGILEQVFGEHCIRVTLLSGEMQVPYERMTTFRLAEVRPL
jgi:hypothetical protein